jgi:hypothetical protein
MDEAIIQSRIKESVALLYGEKDVKFITNHTIEEDLASLSLAVHYFLFDRDARIREAKEPDKHGRGGSDVE